MDAQLDQLIADIYEAAALPEFWPAVLEKLSGLCKGAFASLFITVDNNLRFVGTPEGEQLIADYVALGRPDFNSRIPAIRKIVEQGFITDHDIFTDAEMDQDPFYSEFMRPRGYGWCTATFVRPPTGELASVSVERRYDTGPFRQRDVKALNRLAPHLSRASLLSARLGLDRAVASARVLDDLGLAVAVLSLGGRLQAANVRFSALIPGMFQDKRERITAVEPGGDALLVEALDAIGRKVLPPFGVWSIPLRPQNMPPVILHLLPVRGAAQDIFAQALSLLIVTPVDRAMVPAADLLQGLFDLTPAEARIARAIGEGGTIEAIALQSGLSRETVRSQLKSVFAKVGVTRQPELVALLSGLLLSRN